MSSSSSAAIYEQHQLPTLQNRVYSTMEDAVNCPKGEVRLVQDRSTGLIRNDLFDQNLISYDSNYNNEQGYSQEFHRHLQSVEGVVARTIGRKQIVEVGCGKGLFLELLLSKGFDVVGFDPTYEGDNPRIKRHFFEAGVNIEAEALILRHVLEHVDNPIKFLMDLRAANNDQGIIYIEVPCFDWITSHRAWFDIFYEHVNYFRLSDFHRMFDTIHESGRLFGGQYLYIVADLASLRVPVRDPSDEVCLPHDFARTLHLPCEGRSAVWGGGSKGVIFSLLRSRQGSPVDMVIDINPGKQGRYLPATGLLVREPNEALAGLPSGSTIYVMNSNYLDEVRAMSNDAYKYIGIDNE